MVLKFKSVHTGYRVRAFKITWSGGDLTGLLFQVVGVPPGVLGTPVVLGTPTGVVALGVGGAEQGGSFWVAAGVLLPGVAEGVGVLPGVR